ncbi:DUF3048 domain-containing protein [Bacillus sp. 03113]|uniref:DUF3048 domain-containing protein n=1 Tax=Bacillus sp. 03113 TaxID=2578211 RepID=UPI00215CFFC4|nr:DUF3048 domain-containing protein [Bacillus sp. 03113]
MFCLVFIIVVSGCTKKQEATGSKEPNNAGEAVDEPQEPQDEEERPTFHFPLTGMKSDEEVKGRAIAVMVNNHPSARPQSGLYKADIVYELLAEGSITRFLAIFQSEQPNIIGPVRSAREYYIKLAKGYNSLYIAHGYSAQAKELLDSGYINHLNGMQYDGTLFERASFRKAPHNSYIQYKNILKGAEQLHYEMDTPPPSLTFLTNEEIDHLNGEAANSVKISYYSDPVFSSIFEYDPSIEKYKRFSNGEQTVDYDTKNPVLVDNVLILEADHKVIEGSGYREINLTSGGKAYFLQKGKWYEVEWMNKDGRIIPVRNGKDVGFVPGKTWINVVPTNPGLEKVISFNAQ